MKVDRGQETRKGLMRLKEEVFKEGDETMGQIRRRNTLDGKVKQ